MATKGKSVTLNPAALAVLQQQAQAQHRAKLLFYGALGAGALLVGYLLHRRRRG